MICNPAMVVEQSVHGSNRAIEISAGWWGCEVSEVVDHGGRLLGKGWREKREGKRECGKRKRVQLSPIQRLSSYFESFHLS